MGKSAFTMIELLMVILIVAVLGSVAVPQFLDFRDEAKKSEIQSYLNSLRVGIKNQVNQARLRCGAIGTPNISLAAILANDITTYNSVCNTSQIPNPSERRFFDDDSAYNTYVVQSVTVSGTVTHTSTHLKNPFLDIEEGGTAFTLTCEGSGCTTRCLPNCGAGTSGLFNNKVGWCYNPSTLEFWAATNVLSECEF